MQIVKPTHEELMDYGDEFKSVSREADDSWRHGSYITQVFNRKSDDTYWMVCYRLSTDGETNDLADETCAITQVNPKTIETIIYE